MKRFFKLLLWTAVLSFVFTISAYACEEAGYYHDFTYANGKKPICSDWCLPHLSYLYEDGIIPSEFEDDDLTKNINRGEFAALICNLYEKTTGTTLDESDCEFEDISDSEFGSQIRKMHGAGFINGKTDSHYDPNATITREEAATILCRVFKKYAAPDWTPENDDDYVLDYRTSQEKFADDNLISEYAIPSVYFLNKYYVLNGMGDNTFAPSYNPKTGYGYLTKEQAIALADKATVYLFVEETVADAFLDEGCTNNTDRYIDSLWISTPDELAQISNYDTIDSLTIDGVAIENFEFLKGKEIDYFYVLHSPYPVDMNCIDKNLKTLYIIDSDMTNTDALYDFTKLREVKITPFSGTDIYGNFDFLSNAVNMKTLIISMCKLKNLNFARNMSKLSSLMISDCSLEDISGISNCYELSMVEIKSTMISDVSALADKTKITHLDLSDNYISDISHLNELLSTAQLYCANFSSNMISQVGDINICDNATLYLSGNLITKLPVELLDGNYVLDLSNNCISNLTDEEINILKSSQVTVNIFDNYLDAPTIEQLSTSNNIIHAAKYSSISAEESIAYNTKADEFIDSIRNYDKKEQVMRVVKYIAENTVIDDGENFNYNSSSYDALMDKTICVGTAALTESLLKRLGIFSKVYNGDFDETSDDARHAWNVVLIDGTWYHCDSMLTRYFTDAYDCPLIALISDEEARNFGYITDACNIYPCSGISSDERTSIVNNIIN